MNESIGRLEIYRSSRKCGKVAGNDEIILFCSKIHDKYDIEVEFVQYAEASCSRSDSCSSDMENLLTTSHDLALSHRKVMVAKWREFAHIDRDNIHANAVLVIRTPTYHATTNVYATPKPSSHSSSSRPRIRPRIEKVFYHLLRPSTGECSDDWTYYYFADTSDTSPMTHSNTTGFMFGPNESFFTSRSPFLAKRRQSALSQHQQQSPKFATRHSTQLERSSNHRESVDLSPQLEELNSNQLKMVNDPDEFYRQNIDPLGSLSTNKIDYFNYPVFNHATTTTVNYHLHPNQHQQSKPHSRFNSRENSLIHSSILESPSQSKKNLKKARSNSLLLDKILLNDLNVDASSDRMRKSRTMNSFRQSAGKKFSYIGAANNANVKMIMRK